VHIDAAWSLLFESGMHTNEISLLDLELGQVVGGFDCNGLLSSLLGFKNQFWNARGRANNFDLPASARTQASIDGLDARNNFFTQERDYLGASCPAGDLPSLFSPPAMGAE